MNNWNFFIVFNLRDIDVKVEIKEINWSKTFFEIRRGRYVSLPSGNFTWESTEWLLSPSVQSHLKDSVT